MKTAVITGASKGIGRATAIYFAEHGYNVVIGYKNSEYAAKTLQQSIKQNGADALALYCDVADVQSVETFIKQAKCSFPTIDVLVNNAGIAQQKLITDITNVDWNTMIATNLSGVFYTCRAIAPIFIHQKSGAIINISSMWGVVGASCEVHYSAAKAGVIGLTKALAKELGPSNIRVNCVAPGVIDTEMNENIDLSTLASLSDDTPLCRIGTPKEVAEAVFYLADKAEFITGQVLNVNGGIFT